MLISLTIFERPDDRAWPQKSTRDRWEFKDTVMSVMSLSCHRFWRSSCSLTLESEQFSLHIADCPAADAAKEGQSGCKACCWQWFDACGIPAICRSASANCTERDLSTTNFRPEVWSGAKGMGWKGSTQWMIILQDEDDEAQWYHARLKVRRPNLEWKPRKQLTGVAWLHRCGFGSASCSAMLALPIAISW